MMNQNIPVLELRYVRDGKNRVFLTGKQDITRRETLEIIEKDARSSALQKRNPSGKSNMEKGTSKSDSLKEEIIFSGINLNAPRLDIVICSEDGRRRTYPVFQQKAHTYGPYSEYMERHGCACCSLTTILAAYRDQWQELRPDQTIEQVESACFDRGIYQKNYRKPMARQMPVSLYGISVVLDHYEIKYRYVGAFEDKEAYRQIRSHLYGGWPVIIETSRFRRKNGHIVRLNDKKYAGSYHTMILLGVHPDGEILFTDSATRAWAGEQQRIKKAPLAELINYMFPQRNVGDRHVYFSRRRNTGGYILIDEC